MASLIRWIVRLVFPRDFRSRFGKDLISDAVARAADRPARRTRFGHRIWILFDLVRTGVACWIDASSGKASSGRLGEIRVTLRTLLRSRTYTVTTVTVLGIAFASITLAASTVRAYLFTDPPLPGADRVVSLDYWTLPGGEGLDRWGAPTSLGDTQWEGLDSFAEAASMSLSSAYALAADGVAEWVEALRVNPGYFDILGRGLRLGRGFSPDAVGSEAIISHDLWSTHFGGREDVLGMSVEVYAAGALSAPSSLTIIGVLPENAWLPGAIPDVLVPLTGDARPALLRLRPGVTAEAAADRIAALVSAQSPVPVDPNWRPEVAPIADLYTRRGGQAWMVFAIAFGLLAIAVANAATLARVRAESRRQEFATRRALGAPGHRLRSQLLAESALLITGAAVVGWGVSIMAIDPLAGLLQARFGALPGGAGAVDIGVVELGVLALGAASSLLVLAAVSAFTLRTARISGDRLRSRAARTWSQDLLVGGQVGVAVTVLSLAGLLAHSAMELASVDMGYDPDGAWAVEVALHSEAYSEGADQAAFHRSFLRTLREAPEVRHAGVVAPSIQYDVPVGISVRGRDGVVSVHDAVVTGVSDGLFETLNAPLIAGRLFEESDGVAPEGIAIVGQRFAERAWPGRSPTGERVQVEEDGEWLRVVGVVGDVREHAIREDLANVYVPYGHRPAYWSNVLVRVAGSEARVSEVIRNALDRLDPTLPVWEVRPMTARAGSPGEPTRFLAGLLGALALVALGLATWGTYGSVAYRVERSTREIRIRIALGARESQVAFEVTGRTVRLATIGIVAGALCGAASGRVVESRLFGIGVFDPGTYIGVGSAAFLVVTLAAFIAARRISDASSRGLE